MLVFLAYPVHTEADFEVLTVLLLFENLIALVIPLTFGYLGFRQPEHRNWYWLVAGGVDVYAVGLNLLNEYLMLNLRGVFGDAALLVAYGLLLVFKVAGLSLIYVGIIRIARILNPRTG